MGSSCSSVANTSSKHNQEAHRGTPPNGRNGHHHHHHHHATTTGIDAAVASRQGEDLHSNRMNRVAVAHQQKRASALSDGVDEVLHNEATVVIRLVRCSDVASDDDDDRHNKQQQQQRRHDYSQGCCHDQCTEKESVDADDEPPLPLPLVSIAGVGNGGECDSSSTAGATISNGDVVFVDEECDNHDNHDEALLPQTQHIDQHVPRSSFAGSAASNTNNKAFHFPCVSAKTSPEIPPQIATPQQMPSFALHHHRVEKKKGQGNPASEEALIQWHQPPHFLLSGSSSLFGGGSSYDGSTFTSRTNEEDLCSRPMTPGDFIAIDSIPADENEEDRCDLTERRHNRHNALTTNREQQRLEDDEKVDAPLMLLRGDGHRRRRRCRSKNNTVEVGKTFHTSSTRSSALSSIRSSSNNSSASSSSFVCRNILVGSIHNHQQNGSTVATVDDDDDDDVLSDILCPMSATNSTT